MSDLWHNHLDHLANSFHCGFSITILCEFNQHDHVTCTCHPSTVGVNSAHWNHCSSRENPRAAVSAWFPTSSYSTNIYLWDRVGRWQAPIIFIGRYFSVSHILPTYRQSSSCHRGFQSLIGTSRGLKAWAWSSAVSPDTGPRAAGSTVNQLGQTRSTDHKMTIEKQTNSRDWRRSPFPPATLQGITKEGENMTYFHQRCHIS